MLILADRLRKLRLQKKVTQKTVAQHLGVHKSLISAYENGVRAPSYELLCNLADYYATTTDYLLGRTDKLFPILLSLENRNQMSSREQMLAIDLIRVINQYRITDEENR